MKKILTIAGSDCSGGAGIQADIKTITAHKMYAMSAVTALTAQNTTGVFGIMEVTPEFLAQQLDCIFTDIVPDAVKIGMVSSAALIHVIVEKLKEYHAESIVVDPVMISTSGSRLLQDEAVSALTEELLPMGTVITPNVPEAEVLAGMEIHSPADMAAAAQRIAGKQAVLIKGGHLSGSADDLLYANGTENWFKAVRVENHNTHGTGCTLSSAIACGLAAGLSPAQSAEKAKAYVYGALQAGLDLGKGDGPLDHCYQIEAR